MTYITQRGVETDFRPYRDLSVDERKQILLDTLTLTSLEVRQKWNITRQTLNHIKFHYKGALSEIEEANLRAHGL